MATWNNGITDEQMLKLFNDVNDAAEKAVAIFAADETNENFKRATDALVDAGQQSDNMLKMIAALRADVDAANARAAAAEADRDAAVKTLHEIADTLEDDSLDRNERNNYSLDAYEKWAKSVALNSLPVTAQPADGSAVE